MFDKVYDLGELVHLNDGDAVIAPVTDFTAVEETELMKMIGTDGDFQQTLDDLALTDDWPETDAYEGQPSVYGQETPEEEPLATKRFGRYGEIYGGYLD